MANPGQTKRRATYQDILDAPEHKVAEIIDGELVLSPRPAGPHSGIATHEGDVRVRIEPFEAIELDLAVFWADLEFPTRASERAAQYELADW